MHFHLIFRMIPPTKEIHILHYMLHQILVMLKDINIFLFILHPPEKNIFSLYSMANKLMSEMKCFVKFIQFTQYSVDLGNVIQLVNIYSQRLVYFRQPMPKISIGKQLHIYYITLSLTLSIKKQTKNQYLICAFCVNKLGETFTKMKENINYIV